MIKEATEIISNGKDLTVSQMEAVMEEIMSGNASTESIVSFLVGLNAKGQTVEELTAAVSVMRRHVVRIQAQSNTVLDTCGTGGDKKGSFNVSTASAFVVSGCGITVAKHGNRSVSSCCGSADILEALGLNINMSKEKIEECLNNVGMAFLFAQNLHPAMKYAMPARKQIATRTIFNLLGPLTNPAFATHQLVGVFEANLTQTLARVLANLGTVHALVVAGSDGLDEITTTDSTQICEENRGRLENYEIKPEDFGFRRVHLKDLAGGSASDNARILLDVLNGKPGSYRDIVLLNAAAAIYTADRVKSIKEGIELARQAIDSKKALNKLELLKSFL